MIQVAKTITSRLGNLVSEDHSEGPVARAIEEQTAKLPSDLFLWAAGGSMLCSLGLHMMGRKHDAILVGCWAPTLLILGLYNKIVKVAGHEGEEIGTRSPQPSRFASRR